MIETRKRIEAGILPEELNDLPFNPLEIEDNPLDLKETIPGTGLIHDLTESDDG
jgi:hypothetical protein